MVDSIHNDAAPIISSSNAQEIPNGYIIQFKDHVKHADAAAHHEWVQELHLSSQDMAKTELKKRGQTPMVDEVLAGLKHTYNLAGSFMGYSGHFDEDVIEQIRRHPDVSSPVHLVHFRYPLPAANAAFHQYVASKSFS